MVTGGADVRRTTPAWHARAVDAPLHVPTGPTHRAELIRIGLSPGPCPMRATRGVLRAVGRHLRHHDRATPQDTAIPYDETNDL